MDYFCSNCMRTSRNVRKGFICCPPIFDTSNFQSMCPSCNMAFWSEKGIICGSCMDKKAGYHKKEIKKGELGHISKIQEELDELKDAREQNCKIMELLELSDLYGAIKAFLEKNHPDYSMSDLERMSSITERVFKNGKR